MGGSACTPGDMTANGAFFALMLVLQINFASVKGQTASNVPTKEIYGCLTDFSPTNPDFDTCKERPCLIFLRQEPYIVLESDLMRKFHANRSIVFDCMDSSMIPGLSGIAFDIMSMTSAKNSACMWGGPRCFFKDMVDFIDNTAQSKETGMYQFAATGLLVENSHRVRKHVFPSVSLFTEQLVITGTNDVGQSAAAFLSRYCCNRFILRHGFVFLRHYLPSPSSLFLQPSSSVRIQ